MEQWFSLLIVEALPWTRRTSKSHGNTVRRRRVEVEDRTIVEKMKRSPNEEGAFLVALRRGMAIINSVGEYKYYS